MFTSPQRVMASRRPLLLLRSAGVVEGATLIVLMLVAVPLKRLFGVPELVSIMGPVHGVAFLFYLYAVVEARSAGEIGLRSTMIALVVCLIPFGTWLHDRSLKRQSAVLATQGPKASAQDALQIDPHEICFDIQSKREPSR